MNIRTEPGTGGPIVAQLQPGDTAEVIGGTRDMESYTWVNIRHGESTGWAVKQYLAPAGNSNIGIGTRVRVFDGELILRAQGSLAADIVAVMPDATYAEVTQGPTEADGHLWYRVTTSRYGSGWAAGDFLTQA